MAVIGILWLAIIGMSIWVAIDASNIGARKGLVKGLANMGPAGWFFLQPSALVHWLSRLPRQALRNQDSCCIQ
jgi:hypothetical protein